MDRLPDPVREEQRVSTRFFLSTRSTACCNFCVRCGAGNDSIFCSKRLRPSSGGRYSSQSSVRSNLGELKEAAM